MYTRSLRPLSHALLSVTLIAVGLSVGGCDLFGSDDDSPEWTGTWTSSTDDVQSAVKITTDRWVSAQNVAGRFCETTEDPISNVDGNVVTVGDPDVSRDTDEFRLEVQNGGDELAITDLEEGSTTIAQASDEDSAAEAVGCN
jgi:hypothetical protein